MRLERGLEYSWAMHPKDMHKKSRNWLSNCAIPLWLENGIDWEQGGFFETLSTQGKPVDSPKRAMVQARQAYSFRMAELLGCVDRKAAHEAVSHGLQFMLKFHSLPSGAFMHSVSRNGSPHQTAPDLYAQAFALFGLAHAYAIEPKGIYKDRAKALISYLQSERRCPQGGYFELKGSERVFESNPQMHLFEAALSWMDVDSDPLWRELADEMATLCLEKFIDRESGVICERFDSSWEPLREAGCFVFEPGHQYEWAWLLGWYQRHTGKDFKAVRSKLFEISEKSGICPSRKTAYDELWSDLRCKTSTSRFWPQCERIKAAVQFGLEAPKGHGEQYFSIADEALSALFRFLETSKPGLWFDRCSKRSDGNFEGQLEFTEQPAKASSLYHIVGAINEYLNHRPQVFE